MYIMAAGYLMLFLIVVLLIRGKYSLTPVFILVPIITALLCGFSLSEIEQFIADGIDSVLNTALLFVFSITYFSILGEIGLFDLMVQKITQYISSKVTVLLVITVIIAMVVQMDGSGAMTMLITIPAMLPLFDTMKVPRTVLVFLVSAAAGVMNVLPWSSAMLRVSAGTGLDAVEIWKTMLPLQVIGAVVTIALAILIGHSYNRRKGEISESELELLKQNSGKTAELKVPFKVLVFDIVFTIALIGALLSGVVSSTMGFMIGLSVVLIINFPDVKEQERQIKKHGKTAFPLVMVIFSLGVLIGIMQGTGMVDAIAQSLIRILPANAGKLVPFLYGLVAVPISVVLGSDCCYSILAPIIGTISESCGGSMMEAAVSVALGSSFAANITFIGPAPYLSIGLAGITMKEHLAYSFKYLWLISVILVLSAGFLGILTI